MFGQNNKHVIENAVFLLFCFLRCDAKNYLYLEADFR